MNRYTSHTPPHGFTLIELLVVIGILAVIAAFVGPNLIGKADDANVKAAKIQLEQLSAAIDMFRLDVGKYPQNLSALLENNSDSERWNGPYLKKKSIPKDPWGNNFNYMFPGEHGPYDLLSYGADGQEGGEKHNADIDIWD
jgi:general secretion pathway protein G